MTKEEKLRKEYRDNHNIYGVIERLWHEGITIDAENDLMTVWKLSLTRPSGTSLYEHVKQSLS